MRYLFVFISALLLTGCSTFSGTTGQFMTSETVSLNQRATSFTEKVIAVGERLGYQYTGGDRSNNVVRLADQPNFGQSMIGRAFSVQLTLTLQGGGRSIKVDYISVGDRSAGAKKSEQRLRELRSALQAQFGS